MTAGVHPGAGLLAAAFAAALPACSPAPPPHRNIILISVDTLRADHTSVYGYARETTPYLEALAREGVVFERAFSPAAWTLLSHMTMLTGLYSSQHGVLDREHALSPEVPTLAERLHAAGYQTIGLYYEGNIHEDFGFGRGFDVFRRHADADEADRHLAEELAARDPARPFFLFLHLFDVHCGYLDPLAPGRIYDCPPPYDRMFLADAPERLADRPERALWQEVFAADSPVLEGVVALYDGGVRAMDDRLGGWIEGWRAEGLLDDALLIVTGDHGESLGTRGYLAYHGGCFQDGLRVPLLVRRPDGWRAGERDTGTVHLVDVTPTALEWAGLPPMPRSVGRSLFAPAPPDRAVLAYDRRYHVLIRWPRKSLWLEYPRQHPRAGEEVYWDFDLDRDPAERDRGSLDADGFAALLDPFLAGLPAVPPAIPIDAPPPGTGRRRLEALGYGDDDH